MTVRRALAALGLFLLAACTQDRPGASYRAPAGTPVMLISIDTLRSDHLPAYGYRGVETPAIDALRAEGILFRHAYSHTPLTLPSHASVLTGLLPAEHGVRDNVGYALDAKRIASGELPYLPQILKTAGHATGGAVSAFVLRGKTGLETGFDFYEDSIEFQTSTGLGGLQRGGGETLALARDWLRSVAGKPFFFFFHLYEPHTPYQPPAPFAGRYAHAYDGEIAAADQVVGALVAELRELGVYDEALVVLFSDHGEGLGEHGEDEHGLLLYRESLEVPLLVKLPGGARAGEAVEAPAQLVDVVPTVLGMLGLPLPPALPGTSLLALGAAGEAPRRVYSETFYPRLHFGWSDLASLIDGRHHFIEGPDPELYDLAADPRETRNVLREQRRPAVEMRQALAAFDRELRAPAEVDEETRQALAALGYLGGTAAAEDGPLADPKSRIGSLADFKLGILHHSRREYREAVASFSKVLAVNPRLVDAWEFLGRTYEKLDQPDQALAAYREALSVSGGSPEVALNAASLYFDQGRLEEAEEHARLALVAHPSFAHGLLSQVALARQDLEGAEREARAAISSGESRVGPLVTLASVLHAKGAFEEALATAARAEEAYGERRSKDEDLLQGLELIRGKALADLGKAAEAEAAFRREIERFPATFRAYSNLALLYALSGRPELAGPTLKRMVEASPSPAAYAEAVRTLRVLKDEAAARSLLAYARRLYPASEALRALS